MTNREIYDAIRALEQTDPIPHNAKRFTWPFKRHKLRHAIMGHGGSFQTFLHWPTVQESLYAGFTDFAKQELALLNRQHRLAAIDPIIGLGPIHHMRGTVPLSSAGSSGTYIRQALACQYLHEWLDGFAGMSSIESIFEFGGGYGAFACVAARLGFWGKHTIFDFPELAILQRWYHKQLGLIKDMEYITELAAIPAPVDAYYDVFIAIHSLDETSLEYREQILRTVNAGHYLIWFTNNWGDINNETWFLNFFENEFGYQDSMYYRKVPNKNQGLLYVEA